MFKATQFLPSNPEATTKDVLANVLHEGAQKMLIAALNEEVAAYIDLHRDLRDEAGRRLVVRNGKCPKRRNRARPFPTERKFCATIQGQCADHLGVDRAKQKEHRRHQEQRDRSESTGVEDRQSGDV